jgi:hypothetical protein
MTGVSPFTSSRAGTIFIRLHSAYQKQCRTSPTTQPGVNGVASSWRGGPDFRLVFTGYDRKEPTWTVRGKFIKAKGRLCHAVERF